MRAVEEETAKAKKEVFQSKIVDKVKAVRAAFCQNGMAYIENCASILPQL
ncbi:MAG: hypothetical protein ACI4MP_07670 [Candidatus Ventricola sp.]